jgi:hypothetical protein
VVCLADCVGVGVRIWWWYLLVGGLAAVPIVAIPDSWWYTAWYDLLGLSSVVAILVGAQGAGQPATDPRHLAVGSRGAVPIRHR